MEWIRTFREKQQSAKQNSIMQDAHRRICLDDFEDKIYIAVDGTPMILIDDKWTPKEILNKLEETRNSYINYRMQQSNLPKVAAL